MLNRPHNWDTIEPIEFGSFEKLPPGAYTCVIRNAYAKLSTTKKQMLVLEMDVDSGEYAGFFSNKQKLASVNQLTEGNSLPFFKSLINAIEASNEGYIFDFDPKTLIGRRCCAVFREEEFVTDKGAIAVSCKIWYITSLAKMAEGIEVPKLKALNGAPQQNASFQGWPSTNGTQQLAAPQGYSAITESIHDDDLPF